MTGDVLLTWHKATPVRLRGIAALVGFAPILVTLGVCSYLFGMPWLGAAWFAFAVIVYPVAIAPRPRISLVGDDVTVAPKLAVINTTVVAPVAFTVTALFMTAQWTIAEPADGFERLPYLTGLMWVGTAIVWRDAAKTSGWLVVNSHEVSIPGHFSHDLSDTNVDIVLAQKYGFPHLKLRSVADKNNKRMVFPTKRFGLEANSVYSTLRHLAETDEETRRSYSPELIREMLLFTPDREVAVGESIEVRIVARPEARTA
ncbi:MAG: hypothetical protein PGN29_08790 [Gordonia paraffinivorans]